MISFLAGSLLASRLSAGASGYSTAAVQTFNVPKTVSGTIVAHKTGTSKKIIYFSNYREVKKKLQNASLTNKQRNALESIPTSAVITTSTIIKGTDPVMSAKIDEQDAVGITVWQFEANQGFNKNGYDITSVAPANFSGTSAYYPGWSVSNEYNEMSNPDINCYSAQSTNQGVFTYTPYDLTSVETQTATIEFNFNGTGYWSYNWNVTTG